MVRFARFASLAAAFACVGPALSPAVTHADPLPAKDSSSASSISHQLGFSHGTLYLYTGNSLYDVDLTDRTDPGFNLVATGFESALGDARPYEGDFVTAGNGAAAISYGFSSGGMAIVDLDALSTQSVPDATTAVPDFDAANLFSLAGRADGTFYAQAVAADFSTSTALYRVDPVTGDTAFAADPAAGSGFASGGIAFDDDANLYATAFDFSTFPFPDPRGAAHFYRVDAADLADFEAGGATPSVTELGTGLTNGNGEIVAALGQVYFNTSTGIGQFDPDTGGVTNLVGDITDPDLFSYGNTQPYNGLAFDPSAQELIFARYDTSTGGYVLDSLVVPEPGTGLVVLMGLGLAAARRSRKA